MRRHRPKSYYGIIVIIEAGKEPFDLFYLSLEPDERDKTPGFFRS